MNNYKMINNKSYTMLRKKSIIGASLVAFGAGLRPKVGFARVVEVTEVVDYDTVHHQFRHLRRRRVATWRFHRSYGR
jgi:hypothetical protein